MNNIQTKKLTHQIVAYRVSHLLFGDKGLVDMEYESPTIWPSRFSQRNTSIPCPIETRSTHASQHVLKYVFHTFG